MVLRRLFRRQAEPDIQIEKGLEKTRRGVFSEITKLFDRSEIDEELYEDLEMLLIQADVGWDVSQQLVEELRAKVAEEKIVNPSDARE
ncbi:MAG TPA: signal recognition particle receptor subunit alpha, partial [Thermomicrobiales bacterium]|nr:signal recognition particle receptor subunit alpha [Thermomicrobiales bacterium]